MFKCEEFNKSKMKDKCDFVKGKDLCQNCLYAHPSSTCPSGKRCKKCNKDHHTQLHADGKPKGPKPKPSQPAKEAPSSEGNKK